MQQLQDVYVAWLNASAPRPPQPPAHDSSCCQRSRGCAFSPQQYPRQGDSSAAAQALLARLKPASSCQCRTEQPPTPLLVVTPPRQHHTSGCTQLLQTTPGSAPPCCVPTYLATAAAPLATAAGPLATAVAPLVQLLPLAAAATARPSLSDAACRLP